MKKITLLTALAFGFSTLFLSSCTKEQMALSLLYGTWTLESQLDANGDPVTVAPNTVIEQERTFFRCNDKEDESCTGTTKTTTTITTNGSSTTAVSAGTFSYEVFQKSQIIIDGTVWEIETLKKKELVIYRPSQSKALYTYKK